MPQTRKSVHGLPTSAVSIEMAPCSGTAPLPKTGESAAPTTAALPNEIDLGRLFTLFPKGKRVNIPILVKVETRGRDAWEKDWIIFMGPDVVIFPSNLALCGSETLLLRRPGELEVAPAVVLALQYDGPRAFVAVRFLSGLPDWLCERMTMQPI